MKINFDTLITGLNGALDLASHLAPLAEALGLPAEVSKVADAVSAATAVASNVVARIEEGKIVAANGDAANVRAILADLQAANDALAAKIAGS